MTWDSQDKIRLVALVGAFITFLLGVVMMWRGVAAEGAIDLKSSLISGSLKTGSAGLFISFLSFIVIIFVVSGASQKMAPRFTSWTDDRSRFKRLLPVLFTLLIAFGLSITAVSFGHEAFGFVAFATGVLLLIVTIAMLTFLESE